MRRNQVPGMGKGEVELALEILLGDLRDTPKSCVGSCDRGVL